MMTCWACGADESGAWCGQCGSPISRGEQATGEDRVPFTPPPLPPPVVIQPGPPKQPPRSGSRTFPLALLGLALVLAIAAPVLVLVYLRTGATDQPTRAADSGASVSSGGVVVAPAPASDPDPPRATLAPTQQPMTAPEPPARASDPEPADGPALAPTPTPISVPANMVICSTSGSGIAATSMADNTWTSCVFADIVRERYRDAAPTGGAVDLPRVFTPKFNRYWDLTCENTEPVHCHAPADADVVVYLRRG